ncbi:MAG: hypothetical protein QG670_2115 [Thermoproteota archaeon]|nr:hypothetical protein [Thermoproteota archaeon]
MTALIVRSNTKLFQVLFLENNSRQNVYVNEVKEIDLEEIKKHLERGDSIFITSRKEQKL